MTPTNEGDSPFDVIVTPEGKQQQESPSKGIVGGLEEFAKSVIAKFKKDDVNWIEYAKKEEENCCYQELQRIIAKIITECHPEGQDSQLLSVSDLLA